MFLRKGKNTYMMPREAAQIVYVKVLTRRKERNVPVRVYWESVMPVNIETVALALEDRRRYSTPKIYAITRRAGRMELVFAPRHKQRVEIEITYTTHRKV